MDASESEFCDVKMRCEELGCNTPEGIAILPRNLATATTRDELVHESSTLTVRKLLREAGIDEDNLEADCDQWLYAQENDVTWIGPVVLFMGATVSQNPQIIAVTYGVIANYLTDLFKGTVGRRHVRLKTVLEKTKTKKFVEFNYEGDPEGLNNYVKTVMKAWSNEE